MKRLAAVLLAICLAFSAPAFADHSPGVVTHWELNHVHRGESKHDVQATFGTRGRWIAEWYGPQGNQIKTYRYTDKSQLVEAHYRKRAFESKGWHLFKAYLIPNDRH